MTVFLASWTPMAMILAAGWVAFHQFEGWFLYLVGSSVGSFCVGSCLFYRRASSDAAPILVDHDRFERLLHVTFAIAAAGFAGYLVAGIVQVGWRGVFLHPEVLRSAMTQGTFSDPLKMLNYANIVFPVLVIIGAESMGKMPRVWWLLAVFCALTTLLSTGRTKVVWVLVWSASTILLSRERTPLRKTLPVAGLALFLSLAVFGFMAVWMRKYFSLPLTFRFAPDLPESMGWLLNPLFYIAGGLPYFQEAISGLDGESFCMGNLLLPYWKLFGFLGSEMPLSSELLPVLETPLPANVGTWLIQFYLDLGIPGTVVLPFVIGACVSWILTRPTWPLNHPMRLYFGGLLLYVIWMGFMVNKLISTPTWLFLLLGYPALRWVCMDYASRAPTAHFPHLRDRIYEESPSAESQKWDTTTG